MNLDGPQPAAGSSAAVSPPAVSPAVVTPAAENRRRDQDPTRFGTEAFYASIGRAFVAMCAVVPVLFVIEGFDRLVGGDLDIDGGIIPRRIEGLDGIVFGPFLHVGFAHLLANSIPLILLGTFVLAAGARRFILTTVLIALVSGLGVWWLGASGSVVVGASGVVFGYLGVLLMRGLAERSLWNAAVGALIGLLYGWQLVGVLPMDEEISWQAHLFGFLGGLLAALVFRRRRPRPVLPTPISPAPSGPALNKAPG